MSGYRYGSYHDGPDPLEPPYDVRGAVDELGESVLSGDDPATALRDLLRRGLTGHRGLEDLLRQVRERQRELRRSGRLDGILEQARALLDTAIGQERAELFPDPGDDARLREAELDALPSDTAGAIRELADYQWRSDAARQSFEQLKDLLRREVLDSQFRGIKEQMSQSGGEGMQQVKEMMSALTDMIQADARGEHTQQDFDDFMEQFGEFFPDSPANLGELVDSLVRRMQAAQRLLNSLTDEQRSELAGLMAQAMEDAGLAQEMARLADALRSMRPDVDWDGQGGERMTGRDPLGLGDATSALAELADLAELEDAMRQDYPGARLDDIDEEAVRRALGRQAVDDMEALRQIERELQRQGYLTSDEGKLELTPKAVRRLGDTALRKVFAKLAEGGYGDHDQHDVGQAGELTGSTRPWRFGDEQPIDTAATVRNALLRGGVPGRRDAGEAGEAGEPARRPRRRGRHQDRRPALGQRLRDRRDRAARVGGRLPAGRPVLLDGAARHLELGQADRAGPVLAGADQVPAGRAAGDRILQLRARTGRDGPGRARLGHGAGHEPASRTGAGRPVPRPPAEHEPVVLVITDGEPTAHLRRDGSSWFDWPPSPETLELTMAEVDKMTRRRATLNIFMLADDERLTSFVDEVARRNGGRVLRAMPDSLGEYVVSDFLRSRRERSR